MVSRVYGDGVIPPGLLCLDISLDDDLVVDRSCHVLVIGHDALGFLLGHLLLSHLVHVRADSGDVRVDTLVPVQEALKVDDIADLQLLDCLVDIALGVTQIGLYGEVVGLAILGYVEIQVVALFAGAVPIVQEGCAVLADLLDGHAGEADQTVHLLCHRVGAKENGDILRLCDVRLCLDDLEGGIRDLNLAAPLGLVAGYLDLGAGNEKLVVLLGASHVVDKVSAIHVSRVYGDGVIPPGLLCLDIGLDDDLVVNLSCHVLVIGHDTLGLRIHILVCADCGDVRVRTLIPVQEAFHIDDIADLELFDCLVDIALCVAQIGLYGEGIGLSALGNVEVQVVALFTGAVPIVQECLSVADLLNGHTGEGNVAVLQEYESLSVKDIGNIVRLGDKLLTLDDLEGRVCDLDLAAPLGLVAGDTDLGAGNEELIVLLGAGHVVDEVSSILICRIDSDGVIPPGLLCLDIHVDDNLIVDLGCHVLSVAHYAVIHRIHVVHFFHGFRFHGFGFHSFGFHSFGFHGFGFFHGFHCFGHSLCLCRSTLSSHRSKRGKCKRAGKSQDQCQCLFHVDPLLCILFWVVWVSQKNRPYGS